MVKTLFCKLLQLLLNRLQKQQTKNVVTVIVINISNKQ